MCARTRDTRRYEKVNAMSTAVPISRVCLDWTSGGRRLEAREPWPAEVAEHAARLRDWYNEPGNAAMMGGSGTMTARDVVDFWSELSAAGGRGFLAYEHGELVGDADLRGLRDGTAEFALMIGPREKKGKGLGRMLALMVHVFALRDLGLERLYVPPRRDNARVHALNAFLGYARDESAAALAFSDGPDAVMYSIGVEEFALRHPLALREVRCRSREALTYGEKSGTAAT